MDCCGIFIISANYCGNDRNNFADIFSEDLLQIPKKTIEVSERILLLHWLTGNGIIIPEYFRFFVTKRQDLVTR